MENKLYYKDAYLESFNTNLLNQSIDESGRFFVTLEKTAFYPTGGGQPFDTGTLNGSFVYDVEEVDGEIRHYVEKTEKELSGPINGVINWERRFDHMQQHAGQHILSAAFMELYHYETVSFHLGQEVLTIDLDIEELSEEAANKVEALANQIILENRPIETKWISESELSQYPLRKQPNVTENIRLVIIPEFDYNGCGGTHPLSTGQVGSIKILDWEKQRKKIRVRFACGGRVLKQLHVKQKILIELTKLLNAPEQAMVDSLTRILDNAKSVEKQLEEYRQLLLEFEAKSMINNLTILNENSIIAQTLHNRSMKEIQKLAKLITNENENIIVLLISENETQIQLVAARGSAVTISMKNWLAELLSMINGKGGGNDSFAQGGGESSQTGDELIKKGLQLLCE